MSFQYPEEKLIKLLTERVLKVRNDTIEICRPLKTEDYVLQVSDFASPAKWHLGHTSWFFETFILKEFYPEYKEFDSKFGFVFNSYYLSAGEKVARDKRGNISRPTVKEVYEYRDYVDKHLLKLTEFQIDDSNLKRLKYLLEIGLNHEQQHQELLYMDIKYSFFYNPLKPVFDSKSKVDEPDFNNEEVVEWISMEEGVYDIGHSGNQFCYDNELEKHKVYLNDFQISSALVTNKDFAEFISEGGYKNFVHWHDEGWKWVQENNIEAPLYWIKERNGWFQFTLQGIHPILPNDKLKHISYYEASAFASWKGLRLPTEFEWEAASGKFKKGSHWEWTNSAYLPYPGFKIAKGALGEYNGKFMINQMVLRGASKFTPEGHSRDTYRNFFHPYLSWQMSGIRLAK
ncbi:MAG: ergothioneine biosynthesis protein EgtB [Chitinophagaceae bacterium]|nr:MAG: ergothioneine biosynthesis protein EgtB [Chitinophagaceae bacterium]